LGPNEGATGHLATRREKIGENAEGQRRLPNQRVLLKPARGAYEPNRAYCYEGLPLLWGTHIGFAFGLAA
jgi:hypothetical protein